MTKQNEKDAKRVPELQFKGFTDDWEQRKFSDIYKKSSEKNDLSFSKDKVISVANNKWGTAPKNSTDKYMRTYYVYRIGDIAFEGNKSKKFKFGRFVENTLANGIVSHVFDIYRPTQKEHDLWFWKYYIHNENIMRDVLRKSTTKATMMTNLVNKDLLKQKLNIPILEEQKKIGRLFNQIDRTITLHEEQHRRLEQLKKALLQKMFADETGYPALRFKGFTENWKQSYLKDIASVNSGRDYKHLNKGNIPVYGTGGYMLSVDKALSNTKDGIGIGRKGTINNPYILRAPFWTVDTLFYVIPYNIDLNFLYGIFQKIDWRKKDESTGVPSLSKENINKTKFKIPAISEQKKIGIIFQNLDSLITLHQHKIHNLKRLKRALLQKMFV